MKSLVIVESPAKAKTIAKYLGDGFDVRASVGHIADLPSKGLAVDVDNGFKPTYELTERGTQVVRELRAAMKSASALYLATDEDREGEAISWHLVEHLKPKIPVRRMVFHEITKSAIEHAVANPRGIDHGLVDAAETRRILDRLFGYEVSPVLWRRVNRGLSAGRVQSPALRLVVEREQERIAHVAAGYWGIEVVTATKPPFMAVLVTLDGTKVATGKDFDSTGRTSDKVIVLDKTRAMALAAGFDNTLLTVRSVEEKPYRSSPKAPFMTSTLQQEGGRKLRLSAAQVMRVAQGLYERGFITYMRTDNVVISDEALAEIRAEVERLYGQQYLASTPRSYSSKVKNAQEAHEAIRPSTPMRSPRELKSDLNPQEFALYELIWQRTLASQMTDAIGTTVSIRLGALSKGTDCEFNASGTTIAFAGYRQVYEESTDDDAENSKREALLPKLAVGDKVDIANITPSGHVTQPPARYTEASLIKKLEELGIGRPSTWASIMQTIVNRGYVWKKGQALVPNWVAFSVINLLVKHFSGLVDYSFTANTEEDLDAIAQGLQKKEQWLADFYFGNDQGLVGLKQRVAINLDEIDASTINTFPVGIDPETGLEVVVKPGKFGPYVRRGEETASVPDTMTPDELTLDVALKLLAAPKGTEAIGEIDGLPLFVKSGRYGAYVQWGTPDALPPGLDKPKMASLFKTMDPARITIPDAARLLSLPRVVGVDPADGLAITAQNGRYGPYITKGKESRTLASEEQIFDITVEQALALLATPRQFGRRAAPRPPLREFGNDPVSSKPVLAKEGKFGVYVTDGDTNASLTRSDRLEEMIPERAYELLAIRRENAGNGTVRKKRTPSKKAAKKPSRGKASPSSGSRSKSQSDKPKK
jgi:DNA topoisomerase I